MSSEPRHDFSDQPAIGECQSPAASTLRDSIPQPPEPRPIPIVTLEDLGDHMNSVVYVQCAVILAETGTTKGGKPFAALRLVDRTDTVEARMWDTASVPAAAGEVIGVRAKVDEFNGAKQLILESVKVYPDEDPANFVRASHVSREQLEQTLEADLAGIRGEFGDIARLIFRDDILRSVFLDAPAAIKNHHAYARGLAEHTLSMVIAARLLVGHYRYFYLDEIDENLVVAGVLLHDLGKVVEYQRDGLAWGTGLVGELVGHIPLVDAMIVDAGMAVGAEAEKVARLRHIVLAHHGRREYGSPVEPRTMEAQIVHQVDMIDSRLGMMREAIRGVDRGSVSEWVRPLGGRVVR